MDEQKNWRRKLYDTANAVEWPLSSTTTMVSAGFLFFGLGLIGGFKFVQRRDKLKLGYKYEPDGFTLASKALGLGSLLCFGTFSVAGSIFVATTGITSFEEFGKASRKVVAKIDALKYKSPEVLEEEKRYGKLTPEEEWNLLESFLGLEDVKGASKTEIDSDQVGNEKTP